MAPKNMKDTFYEDLNKTPASAHMKVVLIGDFNGQISKRLPNEDGILENLLVMLKNKLLPNNISTDIQGKYNLLEETLQEISKKLHISKNRKDKIGDEARQLMETRTCRRKIRNRTMQYHIEKSGGIKKSLKELKENTAWITSIKSKATGKKETKRPETIEIARA
ncbi:hypothetical protein EVAR_8607_1 [Eumeta japonica]|uniref:Endonuclease/exonuclease/phosphatase domain-containing protein n=1 Tax=Eumeta variegata TaxID=151549 RepID=A0A4C1XFS2_EUMVA|nr:hypothetical protein EVAR_8607_1 [Eumeta japonica]